MKTHIYATPAVKGLIARHNNQHSDVNRINPCTANHVLNLFLTLSARGPTLNVRIKKTDVKRQNLTSESHVHKGGLKPHLFFYPVSIKFQC